MFVFYHYGIINIKYSNFVDYADGKALREEWDNLREFEEMREDKK